MAHRRSQATPTFPRHLIRLSTLVSDRARHVGRLLDARTTALLDAVLHGPRLARLAAYTAVAATVLALPAGSLGAAETSARAASVASLAVLPVRAQPVRAVLPQQRPLLTVSRDTPPEVRTYEVQEGDTLLTIAAHFGVTVETVAFNNGIEDPTALRIGTTLRIPPMDAAIYTVKAGDTVEKVSAHFKTDPKVVMDTNRLYFEPENFASGKTVLVPVTDSRYPNFELKAPVRVALVPRALPVAPPAPQGRRLAWPVAGVLTQYFWYAHLAVDIGAPYGAGVVAADDGVVSAEGWVPFGGLRVCVRHDWGMETCYYHLSATYVDVGQRVKRGHVIGAIGMTGVTTGPHVHWEAKLNGVQVNPLAY